MSSGIYVLEFATDLYYIGKSDNIPRRWEEHRQSFIKGSHTKRMQHAYNRYGMPQFRVVLECHKDHIDVMESIVIHYNASITNLVNGNKPAKVPEDDTELLINADDELKLSTAEHIRLLREAAREASHYKEKYCVLKSSGILLPKEIETMPEDLDSALSSNKRLYEENSQLQDKVRKLMSRSLWQRIFNYTV